MRLIDADAAIDALESKAYRHTYLDQIVGIIKDLPSAQQWIPCSERLPVEGMSVLLCDRDGDMTLGRLVRTDEGYKWDIYAWWNDIDDWNAWMPLPEPYGERREE